METLSKFINNMSQEDYVIVGIVIVLALFLIHIYSLRQEKKKLITTVYAHVKVFQKAFESAKDAMLIVSDTYDVVYANQAMVSLLELDNNFLYQPLKNVPQINTGKNWVELDAFLESKKDRINQKLLSFPQSMLKVIKEKEVLVNVYIDTLVEESKCDTKYYIITMQDLTEVKKISEMAYQHKLTSMPNHMKAMQDIPVLFSKIHTQNNKIALALMQFDNFSRLRSIVGYEQSNEVIVTFSNYLTTIVSEMNVNVYHTFDNHFLLTISNVDSVEDVKELIIQLQTKLAKLYKIDDTSLHLTVSVGIAIYPESGPTRKLLDNTYKALDIAQNEGDGNIAVYLPSTFQNEFDELRLHNDMKSGLEKGEFEVYYQPIIDVENEEVVAAEALIRWIHPELGFIPPDMFIGLMEKTGFITKLGQFVLEEVLKQQKRWELFEFKPIEVSINVSMIEIATGEFVEYVDNQLRYHQIHPESIKFEITESIAMFSEVQTEKYFQQLKKLGVGISLDDFGTGYTSFTYLKKFPADILKIDKSLTDDIISNVDDQRIVHAIIELGHNLGMKVVVEGVETKAMSELLISYGCDYIQGYYYSKPLPVFEFQKLLR